MTVTEAHIADSAKGAWSKRAWVRWGVGVVGSSLVLIVLRMLLSAWATASPHVEARVQVHGTGEGPLVVLLHGMGGPSSVKALVGALAQAPGLEDARVLAPEYASAPYVNVDPAKLALSVYAAIDRAAGSRPVILVGHSMGGMLLRYAYLKALADKKPWAGRSRFVLLASLNRGWTVKIADKPLDQLQVRVASALFPALGIGGLYEHLRRGSAFVADIRLRWMLAMRDLPPDSLPAVVQVRGIEDSIVRREDTADLEATPSFRRVELADTDHSTVLKLSGSEGEERRHVLLQEIAGLPTNADAPPAATLACVRPDPTVQTVILAVHGIRTEGNWVRDFRTQVDQDAQRPLDQRIFKQTSKVLPVEYGWFPMVPFLLGAPRQAKLRYFIDAYTEAVACYPKANISAFAHSNGTYVVAHALREVSAIKLHRLALAGSVLPSSFDWPALGGQVAQDIANYRANADLIVGVFPHLFELLSFDPDLGAAGLWGFTGSTGQVSNLDAVDGGHSAVVDSEAHRAEVAHFLADGRYFASDTAPIPFIAQALSRACWLVWLAIVTGLGAVGYALWGLRKRHAADPRRALRVMTQYGVHAFVVLLLVFAFEF